MLLSLVVQKLEEHVVRQEQNMDRGNIYIQKELDSSERGSCNILEPPCLAKIPQLGI